MAPAKEVHSATDQGAGPIKEGLLSTLTYTTFNTASGGPFSDCRSGPFSARRRQQAGFPDLKTFEQIQWDALRGVSRPKLM